MKILNSLTDSNIGGAGRLLVHVLRNFDRARFDGWVILPKGSALIPAVRETGFPVLEMEYGADESWDRRSVRELRRMIRDLSPDVVHCHATLSGRVASWLEHVPCRFYTRHSVFPPPKRLTTFPGKQLNGLLNRVISTDIVAVAEAAKKNLTDTGVPEKMITVIVNGVEPLREVTAEECDALRNELGIGREDFVCGIAARLEDYKGHSYLLDAAKTVLAAHPNTVFLIVGEGTQADALRKQAADLGITGNVIFAGFADDVAPYYGIMDLNLNCSWGTEATSLALCEGMSAGIPAVATTYGGNPTLIEDGVNGLLVPEKDAPAMASAISRLIGDQDLLAALSDGARRLYCERFTAKAMTERLETMYEASFARHAKK
ncbi:MAG: glycosyltransferase [Clostridia bacterium]|nr:glycosyltransferase [Clostridia bacterium]